MAEEQQGQEKTEEPTQRKLDKSKQEGQVARSRELNSVAVLTLGALGVLMIAPGVAQSVLEIARVSFEQAGNVELKIGTELADAVWTAAAVVAPLAIVLFVAGVGSSVAVGGFVLSGKAIRPKLERLSPIKGFKRMFSMKSLVELLKSLAKFILISGVAIFVLGYLFGDLLALGTRSVEAAIADGVRYVGIALLLIGSTLIVVAAIDIPFQIQQHKKQLRMTKQEVKDELKDSEGKPEVKSKIRALQQQISQRKMMEDVPKADVIITNPEHFSVAVRYDSSSMGAPVMVAKGVDFMAMRIREIGREHEVPLVAVPPLARAIYFTTEIGEEVPAELYLAVAQVLAYVYQLEQYRRGQITHEPRLGEIKIPEQMDVHS